MNINDYLLIKTAFNINPDEMPKHHLHPNPSPDIFEYAHNVLQRRLDYMNHIRREAYAKGLEAPSWVSWGPPVVKSPVYRLN